MTQYDLIRVKNNYNVIAIGISLERTHPVGHPSVVLFRVPTICNTTVNIFVQWLCLETDWNRQCITWDQKQTVKVTFLAISASSFPLWKQPWLPVPYVSFQKYSKYIFIYIFFSHKLFVYTVSGLLFTCVGDGCVSVQGAPHSFLCNNLTSHLPSGHFGCFQSLLLHDI